MPYTLRIFFVDLTAFVRKGNDFWALLPAATKGQPASDGVPISDHHPVLLFNDGRKSGGDWPHVEKELGLNKSVPKEGSAWLLEDEDVVIGLPEGSAPGPSVFDPFDGAVPKMQEVSAANTQVDPNALGTVPPAGVISRLTLTSPTLGTYSYCTWKVNGSNEIVPFKFADLISKTPINLPARVLADVVVATYTADGAVTISSKKYNPRVKARVPSTVQGQNGATIDIVLANITPRATKADSGGYGRHFEVYYQLCSPSTTGPVPWIDKAKPTGAKQRDEPKLIAQLSDPTDEVGGYNRQICTFVELAPPPQ